MAASATLLDFTSGERTAASQFGLPVEYFPPIMQDEPSEGPPTASVATMTGVAASSGSSTRIVWQQHLQHSFPLPAHLPLAPGGLADASTASASGSHSFDLSQPQNISLLCQRARKADEATGCATFLPSLSVLSHAVFSRLTGCPPALVLDWINALVLEYTSSKGNATKVTQYLQHLPELSSATKATAQPCGYVFKTGDIAWNCRTCQTDPTCVICDECFRHSDHTGHDVFFHRTSPGGCCDCGDAEAWNSAGCCDKHRPVDASSASSPVVDPVVAAQTAREQGEALCKAVPDQQFVLALRIVLGAAVQAITDCVEGTGVGADPVQWKRVWAAEAALIANGTADEYAEAPSPHGVVRPSDFWRSTNPAPFPGNFSVQLRLHNDDVHTFDEVIDALHPTRLPNTQDPQQAALHQQLLLNPLVPIREDAVEKTHHVDADGQVTVGTYASLAEALKGVRRLTASGLHASVVSTAQLVAEDRMQGLLSFLNQVSGAHGVGKALVVEALVQVEDGFRQPRMIPAWCRAEHRESLFPMGEASSFMTRREAWVLHQACVEANARAFGRISDVQYFDKVPFYLADRYPKSPHALWGCVPSEYAEFVPRHPLLEQMKHPSASQPRMDEDTPSPHGKGLCLSETIYVIDTDLRKQQNPKLLTSSLFPHKLPGLHMLSGVGTQRMNDLRQATPPPRPNCMQYRHLLAISSFRAPLSPLLLLLLLDPYPTKQGRATLHMLFLSLLTDPRFKSRFAGAIGVAYRPLSTLFCAGVGTEADTLLHFSVQLLTAGSIVRALSDPQVAASLVESDSVPSVAGPMPDANSGSSQIGSFVPPIAFVIVRCIHTNLLGATKEVNMILKNTTTHDHDIDSQDEADETDRNKLLPALTYVAGEPALSTPLPAAPDDGFLDSRSTRHKRLPHLLRDLEYVLETPGTAERLLQHQQVEMPLPGRLPQVQVQLPSFAAVFCRMLRLAQGMDTQKRKISGGHVEYEHSRWLEAFGLSLTLASARDALVASTKRPEATGVLVAALLRELKVWLYRELLLETGLPVSHGADMPLTSLQRSTLHVSAASLHDTANEPMAVSCATSVTLTEPQLTMLENALRVDESMRDWLRVPHSPLGGDALSFHLPLHRALAKCVRNICSSVVPESVRTTNPSGWWKIPVLDDSLENGVHPLVPLLRPTLRSANCRVHWVSGPDCTPQEAQRRRARSRSVSAAIAVQKVIFSLADHPLRSLAAAHQIERHLWARNGTSVAGMALNYGTTPLCRTFRDLDLTNVQLSASGMACGLGARRVFTLLLSRFGMERYLCDPALSLNATQQWVPPPRMHDPDHAIVLAEALFTTICVVCSELPLPPPTSEDDHSSLHCSMRRELLHALAAEPRSHSEALATVSDRRESLVSTLFPSILEELSSKKTRGRVAPSYELKPEFGIEYDPSYYHLKRHEHQHAMDNVARWRKSKCLPVVCAPPAAHPRFLPCRLLLHLPAMDAALRRALLVAVTNGSWLPPALETPDSVPIVTATSTTEDPGEGSDTATARGRRIVTQGSGVSFPKLSEETPFSKEVVALSSVSFIETLQLLTLQVHSLEECASLHRLLPDLDPESRQLSSSLSINSYLSRLAHVPESLGQTALNKLSCAGSGANRGSLLGFLITLFEHRSQGQEDDDRRAMIGNGLTWLLRFVQALVDGALSVGAAANSATSGIRITSDMARSWTIDEELRNTIQGMLDNLPKLWPDPVSEATEKSSSAEKKSSQAGKAAQQRQLELMRKRQAKFAAAMLQDQGTETDTADKEHSQCIICRCDDVDGNGPLGYLGHVQRSRVTQLRASREFSGPLVQSYRVVGHMGCQLRETEAMGSKPLACLPKGSIVSVVSTSEGSVDHGVRSRRVKVQHRAAGSNVVTQGWASIESSQGYVILRPLLSMCYANSRWGSTRPVIKQCGHAAHLRCVETHTLSLHHRAASEQTYDGRFAANIDDGEFLCPLCKQLSNILIPKDNFPFGSPMETDEANVLQSDENVREVLQNACRVDVNREERDSMTSKALDQFGTKLYSAMSVPWERVSGAQRSHHKDWDPVIQKWDYEDGGENIKNTLRLLRQQLIAWSAIGHCASVMEASHRALEEVLPFGVFSLTKDPWSGYDTASRDNHAMVLELKRSLTSASGLLRLLCTDIASHVPSSKTSEPTKNLGEKTLLGFCLADILEGRVRNSGADGQSSSAWDSVSYFLSSMPCHVSRDATIPQRCEARATASAMWAVQTNDNQRAPVPRAVRHFPTNPLPSEWGTRSPLANPQNDDPFRPFVASCFLYLPLLSWDMNTFAAALYSTTLASHEAPSSRVLVSIARSLLVGRLVQAIVTPHGFDVPSESELDEEDCWDPNEVNTQGLALAQLVAHCKSMVETKSRAIPDCLLGSFNDAGTAALLAGVGRAVLPFARSLVLILRACLAVIRERRLKAGRTVNHCAEDDMLEVVTCGKTIMTVEDGFHVFRALKAPNPTDLVDTTGEWWHRFNRWIAAAIDLELHHGSASTTDIPASPTAKRGLPEFDDGLPPSKAQPAISTSDSTDIDLAEVDDDEGEDDDGDEMDVSGNEQNIVQGWGPNDLDMDDDEDDEMMQDVEGDADAVLAFAPHMVEVAFSHQGATAEVEDSSDEYSSSDIDGDEADRRFARVSVSSTLFYQPSLLGEQLIGPGKRGSSFDYTAASSVMADLSHLGLVHQRSQPLFSLIQLPKSFVELYNIVNKVKGQDDSSAWPLESEDTGSTETAICLLTGTVMKSGSSRRSYTRTTRTPGACTLHARRTGSGIGVFFLVQKCTVLLMHNNKSAYAPSIFVDAHGEEDPGLKRGRPLFLNEERYRALEILWRQQGIPGEVAQIRSTSDRVIRDNWY